MSPQLLVLLIKTAMEIPALAAEIKAMAKSSGVTDEQWEETASILSAPGGTSRYFTNDSGSATPTDPNRPQLASSPQASPQPDAARSGLANYGAFLATDPSDADLDDGDVIYTVAASDPRGGQVQRFFVRKGNDTGSALPANAIEYRKVSKQTDGSGENR